MAIVTRIWTRDHDGRRPEGLVEAYNALNAALGLPETHYADQNPWTVLRILEDLVVRVLALEAERGHD